MAFFAVGAALWALRGTAVTIAQLAVGDCLYVRAPAGSFDGPVIGDPNGVRSALLAGDAERAPCTASHGHEVSLVLDLASGRTIGQDFECRAAFAGYVGHALDGSIYLTFSVVPSAADQAAGAKTGVCLVARTDGQWMDHPARGSGE